MSSRPLPGWISASITGWCTVGLLLAACGELSLGPRSGPHNAYVSISSTGFGATSTTIADPVVVTFQVVDDSRHEIYSGPHPGHTDCPALNIGAIGPRASRTTAQLPIRVCQFHDELNLGDVRFQATIYVVP